MQGSVWTAVSQMGESERLTVAVPAIATFVMMMHLVVIVAFFLFNYLTLSALL